ncbi:MAG: DUF1311 domain-containing protein [Alphaproteobacteria bacterium]|nr:DUF1311 domain-containing protein [Alphaproteobacteria bacterium]MBU1512486.1 DUF1311 domain-containing protein [Alphaproteobacteria bacterium]MBU2096590.1 DUF1311 domain-containing protein [Alphaproteobacteria bacterium]MBU2151592.1 DUF1311 domain-containing protein [Alphaproteobacteria bacterium]MBU2307310.1 DUF1311 domain-containing protein [Alphaproteobacteria bacterium]
MKRVALVLCGAVALLSGCDKVAETSCTSESSQAVIASIVSDELVKSTLAQLGNEPSAVQATESKVRATVNLIKVTLQDIRTTKEDPDSTKRFCEGTVKIIVPLGMINDADAARRAIQVSNVATLIQQAGFERSADSLTRQLNFTVQPTDDKKKTFGEVEGFDAQLTALGEIVASHLLRIHIDARQQTAALEAQAEQTQLAQATAAQNQADLEMAAAENKLANQAISEVWKAVPEATRAQYLDMQRAWIKKKTADCNIKAAETSIDPAIKEAARLRCDTEMTAARSTELRQLMDG